MVCAIDCALKLFRREKLRNRSLELKLGQRPRLVLIDLSLRERRIANNVGKQIECLVKILDQSAGVDGARHGGGTGVCVRGAAECATFFGYLFPRPLAGAFTKQPRRESSQTVIVCFV